MPLLDHFHPPVSTRKAWEGLHSTFAVMISTRLNGHVLPEPFECEPMIHIGPQVEIDVATLERDDPFESFHGYGSHGPSGVATAPQVYTPPAPPITGGAEIEDPDTFEVLIYRDTGRWKLAAAIELVSPSNKDRESNRRAFATKCLAYLAKGVSVVVIDMVTNRAANLHAEMVNLAQLSATFQWQSPSGLSVVSYRTRNTKAGVQLDVWPYSLVLGAALPAVPLWLAADLAVPLELESPYVQACQSLLLV